MGASNCLLCLLLSCLGDVQWQATSSKRKKVMCAPEDHREEELYPSLTLFPSHTNLLPPLPLQCLLHMSSGKWACKPCSRGSRVEKKKLSSLSAALIHRSLFKVVLRSCETFSVCAQMSRKVGEDEKRVGDALSAERCQWSQVGKSKRKRRVFHSVHHLSPVIKNELLVVGGAHLEYFFLNPRYNLDVKRCCATTQTPWKQPSVQRPKENMQRCWKETVEHPRFVQQTETKAHPLN